MVCLFGHVATKCPKLKHLQHLVFEILVGDLGVEGFWVETFGLEMVDLKNWKEKFL